MEEKEKNVEVQEPSFFEKLKKKLQIHRQNKVLAKEREIYHKKMQKLYKEHINDEKIPTEGSYISLHNINKIYPNHIQAVYDFNLDIKEREFIVFVGPSGCGKSTTLRMIAGLEEITFGDLFIGDTYANELLPKERHVGMVFQSYALYPHMTVYENMAFALKVNHYKKEDIDARIKKAAEILQISELLDRKPSQLSGGQCQRVALGRAIVTDAKVFLMDEPLSNLDAKLRVAMRAEIVKLHNSLKTTTIYVTHDQTEAMTMASRIVVMSKGYVQQIGTPSEIFNKPRNIFVATFIGSPAMNIIDVKCEGSAVILSNGHKIELDKSLGKTIDDFYKNEIELCNKKIEDWKDEYLERELKNKKYLKALTSKEALSKYLDSLELYSELEGNEYYVSKEELIESQDTTKLENFLREYLFYKNSKENIDVQALIKLLQDLKDYSKVKNKTLKLGIRPEHMYLSDDGFETNVTVSELLGSEYYLHFELDGIDRVARVASTDIQNPKGKIKIDFEKSCIHLFDPLTEKNILK